MIEAQGLTKQFGTFRAVKNINFDIPKGQVLGFLGPNGAGKSTTMKMLAGFINPTDGTAKINGLDVVKQSQEIKRIIGYLPESAPSYGEMTVFEFLDFIGEMRGLKGRALKDAVEKMRTTCFLSRVWHLPIETLSKGYKQRVGFAQALIHDPPILILDEPTDGLDPNQKYEVRQLIKKMGKDKTIIVSTHILEEVQAICQRAIIIANGEIVADSSLDELMERSELHNAVTMKFGKEESSAEKILSEMENVEKVIGLGSSNELRVFPRKGASIITDVAAMVRKNGWEMEQILVEKGHLDEVFRAVTTNDVERGV